LHHTARVVIRREHDLEIEQDVAFLRRSWRVQRAGWLGMGAVLVLALAGLFGSGPLSRQDVTLPGLLRVEYQRFARYDAPQTLAVRLEPAATSTADVRVWLDRRYLDESRVETITPPPSRVEAAGDRLVYVFALTRPGEPATVVFELQARRFGPMAGRVGLDGVQAFAPFRQFVYP
jgi:hypothetical protein